MKHTITLEKADLDALFSESGFTLYFPNGQDVVLRAERNSNPPAEELQRQNGSPPAAKAKRKYHRRKGSRANRRSGSRAEKAAAKKEIFFRVLKDTGDIKHASKAASVTSSCGYVWRKEAGLSTPRGRKTRNPRYRGLDFPCRPCDISFGTLKKLQNHQVERHGMKISSVTAGAP